MRAFPTTAVPWLFLRLSGDNYLYDTRDKACEEEKNVPVPGGHNRRVGALVVGHGEEPLGLVDGPLVGALGEEVGGQVGVVGAADALDPDAAEIALHGPSKGRTGRDALWSSLAKCHTRLQGGSFRLTMLPGSVEPRA